MGHDLICPGRLCMKRLLGPIVAALLVLSVAGAGVASAQSASGHPGGPPSGVTPGAPANAGPAPREVAICTPARAGGSIKVLAHVVHAVRGRTFVAVASATFGGGPVAVNLRRAGRSFTALGKLAVPSTQAAGPVTVHVTITYAGVSTDIPCMARILPAVTP
jgi:hypothetical protein